MALQTGSIISWSDIQAVLDNVNSVRAKISFPPTSAADIDGGQGVFATASTIRELYDALFAMNGFTLPAQGGKVSVNSVGLPKKGDLMKPKPIIDINNEANRLKTAYNYSGFNSSWNSGFNSGFNSSFNSGFNSFSCFSSCFSGGGGGDCFKDSCGGWCSGFNAGGFSWGGCSSGFFAKCSLRFCPFLLQLQGMFR